MKAILKILYQSSRNEWIKEIILNAFNKNWKIRVGIVLIKTIPISVLEFLSKDKNEWVRNATRAIKNTPTGLSDDSVNALIKNPKWIKLRKT